MSAEMNRHTTELEDQLSAMLRSEAAYAPSTCDSHSMPFPFEMDGSLSRSCSPLSFPFDGLSGPSTPPRGGRFGAAVADGAAAAPHEEWRARIADWSYRVVDHFRYDREVVSVSMNYFDRFLVLTRAEKERTGAVVRSDEVVDGRTYQLAAMSALYLAVKLHGEQPEEDEEELLAMSHSDSTSSLSAAAADGGTKKRKKRRRLRLTSFVELSRGQFGPEDIASMEERMLRVLRWRVNPPTPMMFVSYLLRLFPSSPPDRTRRPERSRASPEEIRRERREERRRHELVLHVLHELSRYLTELSVCLPDASARHGPSVLAYSAILISMDAMTRTALGRRVRREFLRAAESLSSALSEANPHVQELKERMRTSFLPELLLDGNGDHDAGEGSGHPIAVAREAGLLDVDALTGKSRSSMSGHYYHEDLDRNHRRRKDSARGVIEEAHHSMGRGYGIEDYKQDSPVCVSRHDEVHKDARRRSIHGGQMRYAY